MARQNNIPQFDSSDTNIGDAPANGFSANTTIYSAQVNGAIRWSSFAITALLNAIGTATTETDSYEYTGNGATGVSTLTNQLTIDLRNIVNRYTFGTGGTFTSEVVFSKLTTFNDDIVFPYSSPLHAVVTKGATKGSGSNRTRDVVKSYGDPLSSQDYFNQIFECVRYNAPTLGVESVLSSYGKFIFKFPKSSNKTNTITFVDDNYTVKPYYRHHIYIFFKPLSNIYIKLHMDVILSQKGKITSITALRTSLDDKSDYAVSGYRKETGSPSNPLIYIHIDKDNMSGNTIWYFNDNGDYSIPLSTNYEYTVEDTVFEV